MGEVLVLRARLIESYEPLVGKYARAFLWCGAPYDDLYHVGWIGLSKAVELYDPNKFQNGLAAYAIHWIRGALHRFVIKNQSLVSSKRTEHGKYLPHIGAIEHFGNVAVGNGEITRDVSLDVELEGDADNFDNESTGGPHVDLRVDPSLEAGRGFTPADRSQKYQLVQSPRG